MLKINYRAALAALLPFALIFGASAEVLRVDVGSSRSNSTIDEITQDAVKGYNDRLARLSDRVRLQKKDPVVFSMPVRVQLTRYGSPLPDRSAKSRAPGDEITLEFETSGSRAFPTEYRTFLNNVFNSSKAAIEAVFGPPDASATVKVLNYDADISARQAVSGGYYVHNGTSGPEIRFPVYQSAAAAGVNFIHTILLAYMGDNEYPFDAWEEGFVRASTMTVARVPGSIPTVNADLIEATLDSLYDASSYYDWSNTPGLGAPSFIAPNLLNAPLPPGGSTGGIYLLRHQMAGTAWAKVLAEHPGFIKEFNRRFQLSPASYQTEAALSALGQTSLNTVSGNGATVETHSFADWVLRQQILDTSNNAGLKVVPQAFPVSPTAGTSDFGVFGIVINAFRVATNGDETLLDGTCYPLYWRPDFSRFFTSAQDDVAPVSGAYGSVVPNFPGDTFSGDPYRVAVDLPFQGKNARLYLPAGAVATGSNPSFTNVYGTLVGFPTGQGNYFISLSWTGGSQANIPVRNFAFGFDIAAASFENAQPVDVTVTRVQGVNVETVLQTRVNKGRGAFVADLRSDASDTTFTLPRPNRLSSVGFPLDPYRPNPANLLQYASNQTLVARYNPFNGNYNLFPNEGEFRQGLGFFARTTGQGNLTVAGRTSADTPLAVALQPGWNLISTPLNATTPTSSVQVTIASSSVSTWNDARGDLIGNTFFRYQPDPVNPDAGTMIAATSFEPGQAYFVRALQPEGAVLLFRPASSQSNGLTTPPRSTTRSRSTSLAASRIAWSRGWGYTAPGFEGTLLLRSNKGHYAEVELAQQAGAVYGADLREDSEIAPGPGGFQGAIINGKALYRDVRPVIKGSTYNLQLTGLTPGTYYSISWKPKTGDPQFLVNRSTRNMITSRSSYYFFATSQTMTFQLVNR